MSMNKQNIVRMKNAGFDIEDAIFTNENQGYCIGSTQNQYVTWWFAVRGNDISFYHGHYFPNDIDSPIKCRARAYADFYRRIADGLNDVVKYGG